MWLTLEAMICFFILCFFTQRSITQVKCIGVLAGGVSRRVSFPELRDTGLLLARLCCQTSVFTACSRIISKSAQTAPEESGSVSVLLDHCPAPGSLSSWDRLSTCLLLLSMQPNLVTKCMPPPCLRSLTGPQLLLVSHIGDVLVEEREASMSSPQGPQFPGDNSVVSVCTDPFHRAFVGRISTWEARGGPSVGQNRPCFLGSDVSMQERLGYR